MPAENSERVQTARTVLLVDDDRDVILSAELVLKDGLKVIHTLTNPSEIASVLERSTVDVVLLDMNFTRGFTSGDEGLYWLHKIKELSPKTKVVMSTAYGEIDLAVEAIKQGATDFLVKPWDNDRLIRTIERCLDESWPRALEEKKEPLGNEIELIGDSPAMQRVSELIEKVASTDASVLLLGENGTGKDLVANEIHRRSYRAESPFVSVDLGAVSETLFESEMFGHIKGAFTDAKNERAGRFESANKGTLFLDEIGNVSLSLQAKLLGALESRQVTRVGSDSPIVIDVRLICATNLHQELLQDESRFRRDLLYRINTVEIIIPPLRERPEDIPQIASFYLSRFAKKYNKEKLELRNSDISRLTKHKWPGNVRELKHAIERAVILSDNGQIQFDELLSNSSPSSFESPELNITKLEQQAISAAIIKHRGNLTKVAQALGMGRTTLYRKMDKYGISS